ncbi:MAG: LamG domain-containing protein [Deltaproteobacteria bacterium]|nr:LamG domain-containing protein [Deltaproteobacteria bacterium]
MRTALAIAACLGAAGCGRLSFDGTQISDDTPPSDGAPDGGEDLLRGCLLHLRMDEPAWTGAPDEAKDGCGADHHGTAFGGATTVDDPERGRVAELAGGAGCVQVADATGIQPTTKLTVSAWIKPTALAPSSFGIVSKRVDFGDNTAFSVFLWTDNSGGLSNQVYVDIDTENDRTVDPTTSYLDAWRQITVVYDGALAVPSRVQFFADGALTFTASETSAIITQPATASPPLSIGCLPLGTPAQGFVGRISDVAVWDRALSAAEVQAWYAATKPP